MAMRNQKGQFYSMLVIMIAIPLVIYISGSFLSTQEIKDSITEKIVFDQLNLVSRSIEDDFHKGIEIGILRAFIAMTDHVITNGSFFKNDTDLVVSFFSLLVNGTLYGKPNYIMENNTLEDWKRKIINVSTGFNVDFNYTYPVGFFNFTTLSGDYGIDIFIKDRFDFSRVRKFNVRKKFSISFEGLEDPLFAMTTNGQIRRQYKAYRYPFYTKEFAQGIKSFLIPVGGVLGNVSYDSEGPSDTDKILVTETIVEGETVLVGWGCILYVDDPMGFLEESTAECYLSLVSVSEIEDTIDELGGYDTIFVDEITQSAWSLPLRIGIDQGLYYNGWGPSIFDRLEGFFSNESRSQFMTFVKYPEMEAAGINFVDNTSQVAWIYLYDTYFQAWPVRGFQSWFRADNATRQIYNLTDLWEGPVS